MMRGIPRVERWDPRADTLLDPFRAGDPPDRAAYGQLVAYFIEGWVRGLSPGGALVNYAGYRSCRGRRSDLLEGFARMVPLLASWVAGGRDPCFRLLGGGTLDVVDAFRRGVLAGTNSDSPEYWGIIGDWNQRTVESSDIALALWLLRDQVWGTLDRVERDRIAAWLGQNETVDVPDNNWHLFVVLVSLVLHSLDREADLEGARRHYARAKDFHLGGGWFRDGARGKVDYYNAWGFHYALHWIDLVDPEWDPGFIHASLGEFLETYRYLIGPEGYPVMGRSPCYRMAAPVPLVAGHRLHPGIVSAGEARRALDVTWTHFIRRRAVRGGNVTQGYYDSDARILDNYSGPASCLWSLRSLVAAFELPDVAPFWTDAPEPLRVERGDYRLAVPSTGWTIVGRQSDRSITVEIPQIEPHPAALEPYGIRRRLATLVSREPRRPENEGAKYGQPSYSSARPFCIPEGPNDDG